MRRWTTPPELADCLLHGPESGGELFVVEGRSAADAVRAVRDPLRQAVLPLQGKPLNGARATDARVAADPFLGALATALGIGRGDACSLAGLRYERVLLLHDPDADGIHIGALLLMHLARWHAPLLEAGRVERVHAPVGEVRAGPPGSAGTGEPPALAFGEAHFRVLCERARARHGDAFVAVRHRGLGAISPTALRATCVDPATRLTTVLDGTDARLAAAAFGAARRATPALPAGCAG
jgi:DNA gyrase subunit B